MRASLAAALLSAVAAAPPLVLRALLLHERATDPALADLRGGVSDAGVALAVALCAWGLGRRRRWPAVLLLSLWTLASFAAYEHVRALGAGLQPDYAGYALEPAFVWGSLLSPAHPLLLVAALISVGAGALAALRRPPPSAWAAAIGAAALAALLLQVVWPRHPDVLDWRQEHATASLARRSMASGGPAVEGSATGAEEGALWRADLAGEPRLPLPGGGRNVLLVVLEGVSGGYLPSVAAAHGVESTFGMPALDLLARRHLSAATFLAQQRQTNRGEYALLCGDHPELVSGTARLALLAGGERRLCLAEALAASGYATVYLQAAPLGFMMKDQAMPAMGFGSVLGDAWFRRAYARSAWGVDDRAFFEQSLAQVDALRHGGRPWFLTLLTVGTHHPYTLPAAGGEPSLAAAMSYLDSAVGEFVGRLEASGVLKDTLVLLTSDESAGLWWGEDSLRRLSENWGFLVALAPGGAPGTIAEPYMQSDVALSVVDYLGLDARALPFVGRSLFRRYHGSRALVFANTYQRRSSLVTAAGDLVTCEEGTWSCRAQRPPAGRLFAPAQASRPATAPEAGRLRGVVARAAAPPAPRQEYRLLAATSQPVLDTGVRQILFAGQYLDVPAGAAIEVEIEARVTGGPGWLHLRHDLAAREERLYLAQLPALAAGDGFRLQYRYTTSVPLTRVEARATIDALDGGGLALEVPTARLRLDPAASSAASGLEVLAEEVRRAAAPPALERGFAPLADDLGACASREPEGVRLRGCPAGPLVFGPRFYAPRGSRVVLVYELEGLAGEAALHAALGAERPPVLLARGEPLRLRAGERRSATCEATVDAVVNEVVGGLFLEGAYAAAEIRVRGVRAVLEPP
jgi:hypothetical protein